MSAKRKKRRKRERFVKVFIDGAELAVPRRVDCCWAFFGALGVARRDTVALEDAPEEAILAEKGYSFKPGERFVRMILKAEEHPLFDPPAKAPTKDEGDELSAFEKGVQDGDDEWWKKGG